MPEELDIIQTIRLSDISGSFKCPLCHGYLIDCTVSEECGHVFCRSCILRHIANGQIACPQCKRLFNEDYPGKAFLKLKPDHALQRLIYKLVPDLLSNETEGRGIFYGSEKTARMQIKESVGENMFFNDRSTVCIELIRSPADTSLSKIKSQNSERSCFLRVQLSARLSVLVDFLRLRLALNEKVGVEFSAAMSFVPLPDTFGIVDIAYIGRWDQKKPLCIYYAFVDTPPKRKRPLCRLPHPKKLKTGTSSQPAFFSSILHESPECSTSRTERQPSIEFHPPEYPPVKLNIQSIQPGPVSPTTVKLKLKFNRSTRGSWRVARSNTHRRFPPSPSLPTHSIEPPLTTLRDGSLSESAATPEDECSDDEFQSSDYRKRLFVDLRDTVKPTKIAKVLPIPVLPDVRPIKENSEAIFARDSSCSILYNTGLVPVNKSHDMFSIQEILDSSS